MNNSVAPAPVPEDEIDLIALAKKLWKGRKLVIICTATGLILGLLTAINTPKQYTSTSIFVPQMNYDNYSRMGSLSSLASIAGVNIDAYSTGTDLTPLVYPQIVNSVPFQLELMNWPLNLSEFPEPTSFLEYTQKSKKSSIIGVILKYTVGLPGQILGLFSSKKKDAIILKDSINQPLQLTPEQQKAQEAIAQMVTLELFPKDGYIAITTEFPEALAAAQLAQRAQDLLQRYIIEFKIKKVKANLEFIQERYNEAKAEFEKAQLNVAASTDHNKGFTSSISLVETDRLQSKYTIAFGVYRELTNQLEQAKIQVKKETPVFTIVQPAVVPSISTKPNKIMILLTFIFLGGIIGTGIVFGKDYWKVVKDKWKEE